MIFYSFVHLRIYQIIWTRSFEEQPAPPNTERISSTLTTQEYTSSAQPEIIGVDCYDRSDVSLVDVVVCIATNDIATNDIAQLYKSIRITENSACACQDSA